jgi:hypothetical protein
MQGEMAGHPRPAAGAQGSRAATGSGDPRTKPRCELAKGSMQVHKIRKQTSFNHTRWLTLTGPQVHPESKNPPL